jgi:tight adherence protein B
MPLLIALFIFAAVGILVFWGLPLGARYIQQYQERKVREATQRLESIFVVPAAKKLNLLPLAPVFLGAAGFLLSGKLFVGVAGVAIGLGLPAFLIKKLEAERIKKFQGQLIDGLMILSASLKGGLSLLQAIEALVSEMAPPISEEFAMVLRENRMGVSLEDSLRRLNERMKTDEINMIVTAIAVARETGGNLTEIFDQLVNTIREKNKVINQVKTLSIQGKLQGIIMSILPIAFAFLVYSLNPGYFDIMLRSTIGQALLGYAIVSELIGIIIIKKISTIEV